MNEGTEVAAAVLSDIIKTSFEKIARGILKISSDAYSKVFEDFELFMKDCYNRNRYVRILCQDGTDIDIETVYVSSSFSGTSRNYSDHELVHSASAGENLVIVGNGGAGKTFFMRRLWLDLFKESAKTPIFLELRRLNTSSSVDLIAFIKATISVGSHLSENAFDSFCTAGRFVFILDGFDEVLKERHDDLQEQIAQLTVRYPECAVVVSSRFDGRFSGWQNFRILTAQPFTVKQTRELCERVPFDPKFRTLFLKMVTPSFFEENIAFLSNPLLAVMMMMTFKQNMDIPKKLGIFYDQAFTTLYQYHDSTKAFHRKKLLDINQFRRSFGSFCLLSYYSEMFEFSKTEIMEKIKQSNAMNNYEFEPEEVLSDYETRVNLMRLDGLSYVFIHRSFQEYFAAYALTNLIPEKFGEVAQALLKRQSDSVIRMCYDFQKHLVVKDLIKPLVVEARSIVDTAKLQNPESKFLALSIYYRYISVNFVQIVEERKTKNGKPVINRVSSISYPGSDKLSTFVRLVRSLSTQDLSRNSGVMDGFITKLLQTLQAVTVADKLSNYNLLQLVVKPNEVYFLENDDSEVVGEKAQDTNKRITAPKSIITTCERGSAEMLVLIEAALEWGEKEVKEDETREKTIGELFGV